MVTPADVDDQLEAEVREECSKFDAVRAVRIYAVPGMPSDSADAVKVFVRFATSDGAERAVAKLNGRYFGRRAITAAIYDTTRFDVGDLSG